MTGAASTPIATPDPQHGLRWSVVIATRNRPAELRRAVQSVLAQQDTALELLIVDDGSTPAVDRDALLAGLPPAAHPVTVLRLAPRAAGHGPSLARNEGLALARGEYIGFLDDDDLWTDPRHLARCDAAMAAQGRSLDACFSHQDAVFADGRPHPGPLWLGALAQQADAQSRERGRPIDAAQLLQAGGFAHLNCSLYRREFLCQLGGFDEALRYEEDLDLYLRALDAAQALLWLPRAIGLHHIPDASRRSNASTALAELDRHLMRMRWTDRLLSSARRAEVRRHAALTRGYALKRRAHQLLAEGDARGARRAALEALASDGSAKWRLYTLWIGGRALLSPSTR